MKLLKRQVDKQPSITAVQLKKNNPEVLSRASINTVRRRLRVDLEYRRMVSKRKPLITERQRISRMKFTRDKLKWYKSKWKKCLFTDEATFDVLGIQPYHVRRPKGSDAYDPKYLRPTVKQPDRQISNLIDSWYGVLLGTAAQVNL